MNYNVAGALRADGAFNLLAGLVLPFFYRPVVEFTGWPRRLRSRSS